MKPIPPRKRRRVGAHIPDRARRAAVVAPGAAARRIVHKLVPRGILHHRARHAVAAGQDDADARARRRERVQRAPQARVEGAQVVVELLVASSARGDTEPLHHVRGAPERGELHDHEPPGAGGVEHPQRVVDLPHQGLLHRRHAVARVVHERVLQPAVGAVGHVERGRREVLRRPALAPAQRRRHRRRDAVPELRRLGAQRRHLARPRPVGVHHLRRRREVGPGAHHVHRGAGVVGRRVGLQAQVLRQEVGYQAAVAAPAGGHLPAPEVEAVRLEVALGARGAVVVVAGVRCGVAEDVQAAAARLLSLPQMPTHARN